MLALYDHIQELRAELRNCDLTPRERAETESELAKSTAEQAELDRQFDEIRSAEIIPAGSPI